jgi:hypothetical protein
MTAQEYYDQALRVFSTVRSRMAEDRITALKMLESAYQLPIRQLHLLMLGTCHADGYQKPPDRQVGDSQLKVHSSLVAFKPEIIGMEGFVGSRYTPEALWNFHCRLTRQGGLPEPKLENYKKLGRYKSLDGAAYYLEEHPEVHGVGIEVEEYYVTQDLLIPYLDYTTLSREVTELWHGYLTIRTFCGLALLLKAIHILGVKRAALPMGAHHGIHGEVLKRVFPWHLEVKDVSGIQWDK